MGKLNGKVCIVTGASRGIGKTIAEVFAAEGGKVVCAARTLREGDHPLEGSLEHTVNGIREAGGEAHAVAVDISDYDQCQKLVEETRAKYGPVDVLVNNAALTYF
ncbi:MAG: SDR family NAD(P)-dependent oxidoreductase, partial [Planctomycetaceae bacterium]|nr:SDR family NAD(P)-dependent oxidoreductase [Planctomycetaceae bacterium]